MNSPLFDREYTIVGVLVKKYIWVLNIIVAILISYLLAKMTSLYIASYFPDVVIPPKASKIAIKGFDDRKQADVNVDLIIKRNFFDSEESIFETQSAETTTNNTSQSVTRTPPKKQDIPKNQKAVKTSLNINLISTVSVGDGRNKMSSAVVQSGRTTDVYTVNDEKSFAPQTEIVRIMPKKIEFLNKGRLEFAELVDYAKGMNPRAKPEKSSLLTSRTTRRQVRQETSAEIQRDGNSFTIPRDEVNKALANINRLYTEIRAVPYFKNGKANGFKLLNVKSGSLFDKLGLRRGDILKSINGRVLDIQSGLQTFNDLKNEAQFNLEIERRGVEQTYNYEIVD